MTSMHKLGKACATYNMTKYSAFRYGLQEKRRGAWKTKSPKMEAMRLNSGVSAFWVPVSYGEP
jgi:hypothetical protein